MRPPKLEKNFHFSVKSHPVGATPLTDFEYFRGVYTTDISVSNLTWFTSQITSYCWETARRSIRPNLSVNPVGKTMRWIEKWITIFLMASTSSITVQSLGKIVQRATALDAKTWCLYVFLSRSEFGAPSVRGVHSSNKHCVAVYCPISTRFTSFFFF